MRDLTDTSQPVLIPGSPALRGTWHEATRPHAVAVLHGATGVPHPFYRHFANWLAQEQQVSCLTYDYRGFGASAHTPIHRVTATMQDWGIEDQQAARDWLSARAHGAPIWVIGHSLGGLMSARQSRSDEISRIIAVCSGPVHTRDHPWPYQALVRALWYGVGPMALALWGYLPGRVSGLGSDIPGPVFRQWKRWCTTPGFDEAELGPIPAAGPNCPLRTVALSDDGAVPPHVVAQLAQRYPSCPHEQVVLHPADFGLKQVGHTAIFARRNAAMWPAILGDT
ncbi:alpha/beta fold hydrolase [Aliiroseovarius crassostreae]|uniref:alpha/beta hydrolase family protein n=1 Tax=Aliiroseovarius crassostreae TaxID=154981 RepID=UPI0022028D77|nr:alpha/beta fold hydrolase [Aliiroseovarius crassostreae]UWQ05105.1 alpha/beta fold hydrolase [Aliiroseovarius crassostreae]